MENEITVPVWRITPDISGMGFNSLVCPWGWEHEWGLMEWIRDHIEHADAADDGFEVRMDSMTLPELLDLPIGDYDTLTEVDPDRERLIEEYGENAVRDADSRRPSGDRYFAAAEREREE